jgi:hypothetical protein
MAGDVIPLMRVKLLDPREPHPRLLPMEKAPPKVREMRLSVPPSRLRGRELDGVGPLGTLKLAHRIKRAPKMRLFRSFKLFTAMKVMAPGTVVAGLRARKPASGKFRGSAT